MWGSRVPLDHAERSANLFAPFVNIGLIYCWWFGALIPIILVTLVAVLLQEVSVYFVDVFAGRTPTSFGSVTAQVIGVYFSGQFTSFDVTLFANPMFLVRVIVPIVGSIWLVVRLLRHQIGMPEFVVFCALYSFGAINIAITLVGLAPQAIEQLLLPLSERSGHQLIEAVYLLSTLVMLAWIVFHALRSFSKVEPLCTCTIVEPRCHRAGRRIGARSCGCCRRSRGAASGLRCVARLLPEPVLAGRRGAPR